MHGVGYQFIVEACKGFNFRPCIPVVQQVILKIVVGLGEILIINNKTI